MAPTSASGTGDVVADLALLRLATEGGATRAETAKDLQPLLAHRVSGPGERALVEAALGRLVAAGDASESRGRLKPTPQGLARIHAAVGGKVRLKGWMDVRDGVLTALALGLEAESAARIKALARPDGLRAAVLQRGYGLPAKACGSPSRLRAALAVVALKRAFGNTISGGLGTGDGLSAKAGRLLAGQLARVPRDFGTDSRLIAQLAAEQAGIARVDIEALRLAVLRSWVDRRMAPAPASREEPRAPATAPPAVSPAGQAAGRALPAANDRMPVPPPASVTTRPDLAGFAREVRRAAETKAEGWPGSRKAFISLVWQVIRGARPEWGLSEIEFKCMLTEAHRAGLVVLAYADLKDKRFARELQDSAVTYKNTVWHYVRVED